jgi:hypothetical protein
METDRMAQRIADKTQLLVIDSHIEELKGRIAALKERVAAMEMQGYETRQQAILLATMQDVMRELKLLRQESGSGPGMQAAMCPG